MATNPKKRTPPSRRRRQQPRGTRQMSLSQMLKKRKGLASMDFKPDAATSTWLKTSHMTRQQRLRLTKWGLYALTVILCLTLQDVILSQIGILGATTDLPVCAILLITVIEGTEIGSLFVLIASVFYYFSGTAPGPYCIGLLTFLGVGATLFRQMYWHRSQGSIIFCAAAALILYELGLFGVGLFQELTRFDRLGSFLLTSLYSCILLIPLYSLIHKIGLLGGNTWKE